MNSTCEVAIIGAGPYGLAAAAHLRAARIETLVFGHAMAFWKKNMPRGMFLQSPWRASHLADPASSLTMDQFAASRGLPSREPIPLDTPEPKYQDYFNKIRERIKANWVYPRQAGERGIEGELLIEFHIAKDGRVAYIELRHSSGTAILDDAALTAVKLAQPFPPVPDEIAKQTLAINGQFKYQIVSGLVNQFLR